MRGRRWVHRVQDLVHRRARSSQVESGPERLQRALDLVGALERESLTLPSSPGARRFLVGPRFAARPRLGPTAAAMLPAPWRHSWHEPAGHDAQIARGEFPLAADVVLLGKYDAAALGLKLRAAYPEAGLVAGVLPAVIGRPHQGFAVATAHAIVGRHAPGHIPALVDISELPDGSRCVVERWVEGRPLFARSGLEAALPEVVEILARVQRGFGTTRRRLSQLAGWPTPASWAAVVESGLGPAGRIDAEVAATMADLIRRDAGLRCSWTHGDPVGSNILTTADGLVLVDWELAGVAPVARDLAKLHLYVTSSPELLNVLLGEQDSGEHAAYRPAEEIALGHARLPCLYPARRARLAGHPRVAAVDAQAISLTERIADALAA